MFEERLEKYVKQCRWFGGKGRGIKEIRVSDTITLPSKDFFQLLIVDVIYESGQNEKYLLPVGFDDKMIQQQGKIAKVVLNEKEGFLYEAIFDEKFRGLFVDLISQNKKLNINNENLTALRGKYFDLLLKDGKMPEYSRISQAQQSNTSFIYDDVFFLKLYRRLQVGVNPEMQLTKYLTEKTDFDKMPTFAGSIEFNKSNGETYTIALLQKYITNKGDAWDYFSSGVKRFLNKAVKQSQYAQIEELIEPALTQKTRLLAKRTAQLHIALSRFSENGNMTAEPVSKDYCIFLYESTMELANRIFSELNFDNYGDLIKDDVARLISVKNAIFAKIEEIKIRNISGQLIRTHADYHLGQILFTGDDFIISDFEGEPTRSFSTRAQKHIALRDIAGIIRSFHYAAYTPVLKNHSKNNQTSLFTYWAQQWYQYVSDVFLESYLKDVSQAGFLSNVPQELNYLLDFYMLEKAIYELDYELHNRPSWLMVAAKGVLQIIEKRVEVHQFAKNV
jgi:maltose alpha-D-glucosyltransferase/alpha-amylase